MVVVVVMVGLDQPTLGPVGTGIDNRIRVQFPVHGIYLGM